MVADWRRRYRPMLLLVLFVGIAGSVALTADAGARRTATSLERFADELRPADVVIDVGALDGPVIRELAGSAMVDVWGAYTIVFAIVDGVESDLAIWAPRDDRIGVDVERTRLLRGRLPDPTRADEMAVNEMAAGVAARCGADWGLAVTGVAGPTDQNGHPVGQVFVGVFGPLTSRVVELRLDGDRAAIRILSADRALALLATCLDDARPQNDQPEGRVGNTRET